MRGDNPAPDVLPAAPDQSGRQGAPRRLFRTPSGGEPLRSAMTAEARLASQMLEQDGHPPAGRVTQRRRQATTAITPAPQMVRVLARLSLCFFNPPFLFLIGFI